MKTSLSDLIEQIHQPTTKNKQLVLGLVPEALAIHIAKESGIDIAGYSFTVDIYAIKHILKSHGNPKQEEARGQKAIAPEDFELIHDVVTQPDIVFYDGKNRIGRDVLQFQKRVGDKYIIIKEIRTGKKQIVLNSMRIIKVKKESGDS